MDVLLYHAGLGQGYMWRMDGARIVSSAPVPSIDPSWQIVDPR